jgi:hypothetical protein
MSPKGTRCVLKFVSALRGPAGRLFVANVPEHAPEVEVDRAVMQAR